MERPPCGSRRSIHARHWFAYYRWVGSSAPTCRHCGAPNPRYDPERDPFAQAASEGPEIFGKAPAKNRDSV